MSLRRRKAPSWNNWRPTRPSRRPDPPPRGSTMSRALRRSAALTLLLTTALLAQPPAPFSTAKVELRGVVVDDAGKPVANATVRGHAAWVYDRGGAFGPLAEQRTNDEGEFAMPCDGSPEGLTVYLRASHGQAFTATATRVP